MKIISISIVLIFFSFFGVSYSGSKNLFDKGHSGFDISGYLSSSNDVNTIGITTFFSINSIFDLGIGFGRSTLDQPDIISEDFSATGIAPFIGIQLLKQSDVVPISFTVRVAYERDNFQSDYLNMNDWEMFGSSLGGSGSLYGVMKISKNVGFIPSFGISYISSTVKLKNKYNISTEVEKTGTAYSAGFTFNFYLPNNNFFYIDPILSFNENGNAFGINVGLGLPTNVNNHKKATSAPVNIDILELFDETEPVYLAIKSVKNQYILIYATDQTNFSIGDRFSIIRIINNQTFEIGTAKVVQKRGNKVALQYKLHDPRYILSKNDFVEFR
ncbi:MAG: hypothetical protein JW870_01900 [Candidatus Delongbacteria bacterium]|nr:hypothetical protein [Candidatus Delongbacteria bacterium]